MTSYDDLKRTVMTGDPSLYYNPKDDSWVMHNYTMGGFDDDLVDMLREDMGMGTPDRLKGHDVIKDKPIKDKQSAKLKAIDAALRNITLYLSSRHAGRYHTIWHFEIGTVADRIFVCEWRNPEPVMMSSPKELSLKEVLDLIDAHSIYMPAIALDGEAV